jgi:mannan endo-1,4-beta-mannosidase
LREADGTIREEGLAYLDVLLARAAEHDVSLLLMTANHWGDYGGAPAIVEAVAPGEGLPVEAFYGDARAIAHQRAFLEMLVTRVNTVNGQPYATDPAIFAWELVNEGRCANRAYCEDDGLARWAQTMARALRDAGATQPIAWGGQGFTGAWGEDIEAIAEVDEIDVLTVHLYPDHYGAQAALPGSGLDRIPAAVRYGEDLIHDVAEIARAHGKAPLVEEAGWRTDSASSDEERAIVLAAWARAARVERAGFMPWMIAERGRVDYDGYLIRPESEPETRRVLECE